MPQGKLEARAELIMMRDTVEIYLFEDQAATGRRSSARDITLHELDDSQVTERAFELRLSEAQVLMDDLWRAGLRPSEGSGSAGSLRATEKHLDDMRAVAFSRLGMNDRAVKIKV